MGDFDRRLLGEGDFEMPISVSGFITRMFFLLSKLFASCTGRCELGLKYDGSRNWSALDLGELSLVLRDISFLMLFELGAKSPD